MADARDMVSFNDNRKHAINQTTDSYEFLCDDTAFQQSFSVKMFIIRTHVKRLGASPKKTVEIRRVAGGVSIEAASASVSINGGIKAGRSVCNANSGMMGTKRRIRVFWDLLVSWFPLRSGSARHIRTLSVNSSQYLWPWYPIC